MSYDSKLSLSSLVQLYCFLKCLIFTVGKVFKQQQKRDFDYILLSQNMSYRTFRFFLYRNQARMFH